jgi:predicted RNase H-like nuclease (RuvC/YqgF family)
MSGFPLKRKINFLHRDCDRVAEDINLYKSSKEKPVDIDLSELYEECDDFNSELADHQHMLEEIEEASNTSEKYRLVETLSWSYIPVRCYKYYVMKFL